ncbi:energy-coupling factor transporter transmembrane component T family protein [Janibacter cremeus]|uniref:Biotin transport system permease protein n=1 Tax=Janibacter cremeus TaxID=1285192 RepID=A0A852VJD7_9MICO|nr:energy-coupling factor transporter transmembrane protein EcfT [Janibacter cremeus]NYF97182.1 biotin transport system permease protein [Janibacter cremeus]
MSTPALLGDYRPGSTWLHRLGPGAKLLGLCGCAVLLVAVRWPPLAVAAVLVALALALASGIGWRGAARTLRGVLVVAVLLGGWLVWQHGWERAVDSIGDLLALVLLASVLTRTTSVDDMLDTVTGALMPLRRFGADPGRAALTFSLMIRAIPSTLEVAEETRQAALARGMTRSPRARLVPLVIRVVARAQSTGEALAARGVDD